MALTVVKTVTKLGIVGGAGYFSVQQGVWGNSEEGTKAFEKLTGTVAPSVTSAALSEKIPSQQEVTGQFKENWNIGVKTVFAAPGKLPEYAKELPSTLNNLVKS